MRLFGLMPVLLLIVTASGFAQTSSSVKPAPGFSLDNIDKSVDPCVDFYQYACGNWIKNSEIPPDQSQWVSFVELRERNLDIDHGILDKAAAGGASRDAVDQRIGDLYGSCMDEEAVNAKGLAPLKPELNRVAAVQDKAALIDELAHLYLVGGTSLFSFYSSSDLHNADQVIAYIDQGGLTLPDRDYYIKEDNAKMKEMRQHLVEYATQSFTLVGQTSQQAADSAQTVLRIETALAKASMDRTARRDPKNRDHKMTRDEAVALGPDFYLNRYFAAVGAPNFTQLNVTNPDFFKQVNGVLESESLDSLKTYVSWHVLNAAEPWLSQPFVDVNFKFQQNLTGQKEIQARWKRCVSLTDQELGEALGQRYVDATFGPDGKQRMLKMVDALEKSLADDIQGLSWMSDETKKQAKVKLDAIRNKIGYPDVYRDYSSVVIKPDDLLGNIARADEFESKRDIAKIDKPLDRKEWGMTPPTVNAYYSGSFNEIVFPAGILQPPFFDKSMDDAVNFGGIGLVIGHELTHGFDDQGRKYDPHGNLRDWWTEQDGKEFEKRVSCVADEYSNFVAVDDLKLNGRLTLGENTADNGGARIALAALEHMIADDKTGKEGQKIDGYTPEQRFFLGFGRVWCEKRRPEIARTRVLTDPHSPGKYR
ncbi:MAG: M13 family metallopeptidase, partial [Candidatus Sulfotelmatobacter sp.]